MSTPELLSFAHTREVKSVNTRAENDSQCNKPRRKKNWKLNQGQRTCHETYLKSIFRAKLIPENLIHQSCRGDLSKKTLLISCLQSMNSVTAFYSILKEGVTTLHSLYVNESFYSHFSPNIINVDPRTLKLCPYT